MTLWDRGLAALDPTPRNPLGLPAQPADGLVLFVPGDAAPQGSKRAFIVRPKGGRERAVLAESSKHVGSWRDRIALAARTLWADRPMLAGPVAIELVFVLPRPKSTPKRRTPPATKRPDGDKLQRAVWDALTGVVVTDDSQFTDWHGRKRLAEIGEPPGVLIRVEPDE